MYPNLANSFIRSSQAFPQKNALFINGIHYTYTELSAKVHSIYLQLTKREMTVDRIGVYCTNDLNTYASILAVSAYGAAFVPLNSNFPPARNLSMIEASSIDLILNASEELFQGKNVACIPISTDEIAIHTSNISFHFEQKTNQDLAYILFTSGSTGKPKGVPVTKKNVKYFFDFFLDQSKFQFTADDRFIQVFDLTFDVSIFSFFMPLQVGACCYVSPQKGIRFLEIVKMLHEYQITVATLVPTVLQYMERYIDEMDFSHLKYSFFIGDKLSHSIVSKWSRKIRNAAIINFYGPTEATIMCTYYRWNEKESLLENNQDIVPIGKPFPDIDFVLINESNEKIEDQQIGELCLSGSQVIYSYLNHTHENRFFELETENKTIKRFYKTGDLVQLNSNGNLLFYGRVDTQVKINGHRVELNEIASILRKITNDVFQVSSFKDQNGIQNLVLFIEKNTQKIDFAKALASVLPDYMIPKTTIVLDQIPLNFNNKVDQAKLEEIYLFSI